MAELFALAALAVVLVTLISYARDWKPGLFSHFRPHLAATALAMAVVVVAVPLPSWQRIALAFSLLVAAAANTREVMRARPNGSSDISADAPRLRLAFSNVLKYNTQHERLIRWVRSENPDIFIAAEALAGWPAALAALDDLYPHRTPAPLGDLLIFSRWPLLSARHMLDQNGHAALIEVASDLGLLRLITLHTQVPWKEKPVRGAYSLIAGVAELATQQAGDLVVAGDFNATPWSAPVRALIKRASLSYGPGARRGSYPTLLPVWAGLPIDLVLSKGGWRVVEQRLAPSVGSDHRPVVAEIAWIGDGGSP